MCSFRTILFAYFILLSLCVGCRTTPITGRKQLLFVPEDQEVSMGYTAFQEVVAAEKPSTNQHYVSLVNQVGQRIAAVAGRPDYQWEFRVFAAPQQNAFCLPGGKVAVYEGILPICQNEAGLAVVMSHEIAHALARHGGERITQNYAVEGTRMVVSKLSNSYAQQQSEMILQFYGIGSKYGYILRHSRKHESEADHIGVILMARAGYDPEEAPRFWQRFAASHEGPQQFELFSTHPSDERRANDLVALLPDARKEYEAAANKYGLGQILDIVPASSTGPVLADQTNSAPK
jgi:predicted Zn-dependent protease